EPSHDPMKGGAFEPETNTLIISNKNLQPEDSRSFSAGFVYTPKYVPGLNLSVDFWDTERIGVVTAPLADQVLQRELTGTLLPGEVVERDIGGNILRIQTQNQNIGNQESRGFDFTLQYQKQTPWGTFTSLTQATYLDEFIFQGFLFDLQATYDLSGLVPVETKPVPGYSKDAKEVARGKDGSITEKASAQTSNYAVSDWRRILLGGTSITVGVNNVFDEDPPK